MTDVRRLIAACGVLGTLAVMPSPVGAQVGPSADRARMTAVRMAEGESIALDGELNEPVWKRAVPATDFIQ